MTKTVGAHHKCRCRGAKIRHLLLLGETSFPAGEPKSRPPHSSGDTPQRPDAGGGRNSSSGSRFDAVAPLRLTAFSLRSETACLPFAGRLWRYVAQARPFARLVSVRKGPSTTPAALPHSRRCRLLPPLTAFRLHAAPAPARDQPTGIVSRLRPPFSNAQTPLGLRCSLSSRRSRIRSQQSHTQREALV